MGSAGKQPDWRGNSEVVPSRRLLTGIGRHRVRRFAGLVLIGALMAILVGPQPGERTSLPAYLGDHAFTNAAAAQAISPNGVDEGRLRAYEEATLGEQHAAEHAKQREALRRVEAAKDEGPTREAREIQARAAGLDPAEYGSWEAPFPSPVLGINAIMLPTGKVLLFAYPANNGSAPTSRAYVWNPGAGYDAAAFKRIDPPINPETGLPANIWCAGNSMLSDGRVLVAGGNLKYQGQTGNSFAGLDRLYTFNPWNETWREQPQMRKGRWYPTQLLMPDGRTVIMQGLDESGTGAYNRDLEIFTPSSNRNGRGTLTMLGPPDVLGQPGQPPLGWTYPHMFWMPSGRGLVAGHTRVDSWFLNQPERTANPALSWTDAPNPLENRFHGTAVLLPGGTGSGSTRVLQIGGSGGNEAVASSEVFDEATPGAGWQAGARMNVARTNHNTVLLPDRSMVTLGGGVGSAPNLWASTDELRQPELYSPATNTWRLGPPQVENRAYHSTALLLPDGRVMSTGDDVNGGADRDTIELYSPPYLFKGARPRISSAPTTAQVGGSLQVRTPDAVSRAVLIAPSAVTHATDMNQRFVALRITGRIAGRSVTLAAPPNSNIAPPGYYMLFLVNAQGVPSVAKFVRVVG